MKYPIIEARFVITREFIEAALENKYGDAVKAEIEYMIRDLKDDPTYIRGCLLELD